MERVIHDSSSRPGPAAHNGAEPDQHLDPAALPSLQQALTEVTHDINNPLAVIAGNAQLLLELSRMFELDPDVAKPIRDIEEASHRLAATVNRLNSLKETLFDEPLGGDGV